MVCLLQEDSGLLQGLLLLRLKSQTHQFLGMMFPFVLLWARHWLLNLFNILHFLCITSIADELWDYMKSKADLILSSWFKSLRLPPALHTLMLQYIQHPGVILLISAMNTNMAKQILL